MFAYGVTSATILDKGLAELRWDHRLCLLTVLGPLLIAGLYSIVPGTLIGIVIPMFGGLAYLVELGIYVSFAVPTGNPANIAPRQTSSVCNPNARDELHLRNAIQRVQDVITMEEASPDEKLAEIQAVSSLYAGSVNDLPVVS